MKMTQNEFKERLENLFKEHPIINKDNPTFNELVYILRQDAIDCNISIPPYKKNGAWSCIPSVKECFIPVRTLAMHVAEIKFEEETTAEIDMICLTVHLKK